MELFDFFYNELKTLKARTGFNQWDNLNQSPKAQEEINALIGFMVDECNKPPFDLVKNKKTLQRVIHAAVVGDKDFIGLNAKFVHRTLHTWWNLNGHRVIEERDKKPDEVYERVQLTPEQDSYVSTMLKSYERRLLSKSVPKPENIAKEGAEWQSEIEKKAHKYVPLMSKEEIYVRQKLRRAGSEFYKNRQTFNLKEFTVDGLPIMAESHSDAEEIYKIAEKL